MNIVSKDGKLKVRRKACATCIYNADSPLDIHALEAQVADKHLDGYFEGARICHHPKRNSGTICAGFWARHKDNFDAGQIAQRLDLVEYVE